jgi:hypothetical protein
MNPQELGQMGESYVASRLRSAGMDVKPGTTCDLVANGVRIEVKAARFRPYKDNGRHGYQFCLHRDGRNGIQADVVVLLCYYNLRYEPIAFVIPAYLVRDRKSLTVPSDPRLYAGLWSEWLSSWEIIADVMGGQR